MAPPDHAKNTKPKTAKPAKPHALKPFDIADMPPASSHAGELVAVREPNGETTYLAYSTGEAWMAVTIDGLLPVPAPDPVPAPGT
jgi:hypothetical protein